MRSEYSQKKVLFGSLVYFQVRLQQSKENNQPQNLSFILWQLSLSCVWLPAGKEDKYVPKD